MSKKGKGKKGKAKKRSKQEALGKTGSTSKQKTRKMFENSRRRRQQPIQPMLPPNPPRRPRPPPIEVNNEDAVLNLMTPSPPVEVKPEAVERPESSVAYQKRKEKFWDAQKINDRCNIHKWLHCSQYTSNIVEVDGEIVSVARHLLF